MTAVAWTAIGLLAVALATMTGAVLQLGARIDALGGSLNDRIDRLGRDVISCIDSLSVRIDAQSSRIDTHLERRAG